MNYTTQIKNLARLYKTRDILYALAEKGEFTRAEYDAIRKKRETCSLKYLKDWDIIKKVREETFEIEIEHAPYKSGIFTENGTKVMEEYEWDRLPDNVKEIVSKAYGELFVGWEDNKIQAKRYYYAVDTKELAAKFERQQTRVENHLRYKMREITEKFLSCAEALAICQGNYGHYEQIKAMVMGV